MSVQTRETLKGYFNTNDEPTEQQFFDLIESMAHVNDGKVEVANIIDYGAVPVPPPPPDGGAVEEPTDSTSAFEQAIATGKPVYVPSGRFLIRWGLAVPQGCKIFGDGVGSEIFCDLGWQGGNMFTMEPDTTIANALLNGGGMCDHGINVSEGVYNVLIKDCSAGACTTGEIAVYGVATIDGGNYNLGIEGYEYGSFELGGLVKIKNLSVGFVGIHQPRARIEMHDVDVTQKFFWTHNCGFTIWRGSIADAGYSGGYSLFGRVFGTKLSSDAHDKFKSDDNVMLFGDVPLY